MAVPASPKMSRRYGHMAAQVSPYSKGQPSAVQSPFLSSLIHSHAEWSASRPDTVVIGPEPTRRTPRPSVSPRAQQKRVSSSVNAGVVETLFRSLAEMQALRRRIAELEQAAQARFDKQQVSASQSQTPAVSLRPSAERLAKLARLEPNWDSYGAAPVTTVALATAYNLVVTFEEEFVGAVGAHSLPWAIAPLADGGLQVEWRGPGGAIELEIGPAGDMSYLLEEGDESNLRHQEADDVSVSDVGTAVAHVLNG